MLAYPFRVMDVSISMATGAQHFIPATSANMCEVAGYYIIYPPSGQQQCAYYPRSLAAAHPLQLRWFCNSRVSANMRETKDCGTLCLRAFPGSASEGSLQQLFIVHTTLAVFRQSCADSVLYSNGEKPERRMFDRNGQTERPLD